MKQKILFMVINMNIGGTEKALLNMIDEINPNEFEVTILMLEKYGGFLNQIPQWVNVKYVKNYEYIKEIYSKPPFKVSKELINLGELKKGFNIGFSHLIYKLTNDRSTYFKYILKDCGDLNEEYDIAIAYAGPMDLISYYVINKINANKKVQWIHFDVTKISFDKKFIKKLYSKFDKVFVVSKEAKEKLDNLIPSLTSKTEVFHNIVSKNKIHNMANIGDGFEDEFDGTRILTVGRLSEEKGQTLIPKLVKRLVDDNFNIKWYCIGDGESRKEIENMIEQFNIHKELILLGTQSNPYPFIKNSDIYVQTSKHEGYCITLAEAKLLAKPIITTNFVGAREQIENGKNGIIVNFSEDELYESIKKLILNEKLRIKFSENLLLNTYSNNKEINKLYEFMK